jgi:hypothetical protein
MREEAIPAGEFVGQDDIWQCRTGGIPLRREGMAFGSFCDAV